jgi:hypothetical protein
MNETPTPTETPELSPEQIIEWLDGYRQLMWEVWKNNPELRKNWEKLNQDEHSHKG